MSAVISLCKTWRYRLDRHLDPLGGPAYAYFGVNGSTADADQNDHTVMKWIGFTKLAGGSRFIVGNPFALRATDVRTLGRVADPVGPDNAHHLAEIIAEADILVPCWGARSKVPSRLHGHIDALRDQILAAGKPVMIFGFTRGGDPLHPLRLGYDVALRPWDQRS